MTHPTPDDFDQLRGAFDDPVAPAPSFADRLREEIAMEVTKTVAPADIRRTVEPLRAARQAESVPLTSWHGALATAAVIALVLALGFVTIREAIAPERGDDDDDGALSSATVPANSFGQTSASGTPGVIAVPDVTPSAGFAIDPVVSGGVIGVDGSLPIGPLDVPLSDQLVEMPSPGAPGRDGKSFGYVGDVGFGTNLSQSSLIAYDLATNEQRWVVPIVPRGQIVSDGTTAFIDGYDAVAGEGGLFAFDLRTGVERWRITTPTESGVIREPMSPIVSRGVVYAGFDGSILRAIDAVKGTVLWEQTVPGSDDPAYNDKRSMQIVTFADRLLVVAGGRTLVPFSSLDGIPFAPAILPVRDSASSGVWLTMAGETAIVMISDMVDVPVATPNLMDSYGYEETVIAFNPGSLKELWSWAPERLVRPAIMVGDRMLIAVGTTIYDVDPATGERTVHVEVPSPYPGGWYFAMMRTDGEHAWFAYGTENTVEVFQIGVNGLDHQWTAATSQTPHVYDLVADRGGIRIVSDPGPDYYIPAAANLNETVLPSSTIASDDGMYVPNATPEGRDSSSAEGEVPGSYRSQPTPAATIVDNIIQPDEPSPTTLPDGTPFTPIGEPMPIASPVDAFPILPNEPDASPEA
jgi:hypothetical protein